MSYNLSYEYSILNYISKNNNYKDSLEGKKILVCTHQTKETYEFINCLTDLGAIVFYIPIEYSQNYKFISNQSLKIVSFDNLPDFISLIDIIFEDGARVTKQILKRSLGSSLKSEIFSVEQTTNGINFFNRNKEATSAYPIIDVANSKMKQNIENSIAVPETILNAYLSISQKHLCGRKVLIIGYGSIGSGVARVFRSLGAEIYIYDIDSVKRIIAQKVGYISLTEQAFTYHVPYIDLFISSTANSDGSLLNDEIFLRMKNGSEVLNIGSYTGEISQKIICNKSYTKHQASINILHKEDHLIYSVEKHGEKKQVIIYNQGYPINLRQKKGVHNDIMQFTFGLMILGALDKMLSSKLYVTGLNPIPYFIEQRLATMFEEMSTRSQDKPYLKYYDDNYVLNRDFGGVMPLGESEVFPNNFSIAKVFFKPQTKTKGHYHYSSQESYFIQEGEAQIRIWHVNNNNDKYVFNVSKGNYLYIPPFYMHLIETKNQACHCLVIAGPKFSFWDQFFNKD